MLRRVLRSTCLPRSASFAPCQRFSTAGGPNFNRDTAYPGYPRQSIILDLSNKKAAAGLSYSEIADIMGYTNVFTANLFHLQAQLPMKDAPQFKELMKLNDTQIHILQLCPRRETNHAILGDPAIESIINHVNISAEAIKVLVNEKLGDGAASMGDTYVTVDAVKGALGEDRVVVSFNSKFEPFVTQYAQDSMFARLNKKGARHPNVEIFGQTEEEEDRRVEALKDQIAALEEEETALRQGPEH